MSVQWVAVAHVQQLFKKIKNRKVWLKRYELGVYETLFPKSRMEDLTQFNFLYTSLTDFGYLVELLGTIIMKKDTKMRHDISVIYGY